MFMQNKHPQIALGLGLLLSALVQAAPIATIEVTDGIVTVSRVSGKRSIVAAGSTLEEGDTLTTEKDSYARLQFTDGSEVAVRPATVLAVQRYHFESAQPAQDNLLLRIVKGGMRTVTGLIGKRGNEDAYRVQGATATIGIRGTEYLARLCEGECAADPQSSFAARKVLNNAPQAVSRKQLAPQPLLVVARLVDLLGSIRVRAGDKTRLASTGETLYNGETLLVSNPGSASLVFNDETRVVLTPGSEFQLSSVRYHPQTPEKGNVATTLLKGGMRMVTGLLGKRQPQNVTVDTLVATIGIRGTNFDLWCAPSGNSDPENADLSATEPVSCDQALYASTREGSIEMQSGAHKLLVAAGKAAYVDSPGGLPGLLKTVPVFLKNFSVPQPEDIPLDMPQLFGVDGTYQNEAGLYVAVKEGKVALTQASGETLLLQTGEVGYANAGGEKLLRLINLPGFIQSDAYLRELRVDPATCRAQ